MPNPTRVTRRASFVIAVLAFATACATFDTREALSVGCDFDNAPFAYLDETGAYRGRDVEMMAALGAELGVSIEWVKLPFEELLPAAERGEVDAVCATIGVTDERSKRVRFTQPYFETRLAALVRTGAGEPRTLADLDGRRVAASPNTTSELALSSGLPRAIAVLDNAAKKKADVRLLDREVDAVIQDGPDADDFAAASGGQLAVIPEPVATERYAIAVSPLRADWKDRLDSALVTLRRIGVLADLDRRHGLAPK
jgi:ABC-type amino acid transport substrate-binding protein